MTLRNGLWPVKDSLTVPTLLPGGFVLGSDICFREQCSFN